MERFWLIHMITWKKRKGKNPSVFRFWLIHRDFHSVALEVWRCLAELTCFFCMYARKVSVTEGFPFLRMFMLVQLPWITGSTPSHLFALPRRANLLLLQGQPSLVTRTCTPSSSPWSPAKTDVFQFVILVPSPTHPFPPLPPSLPCAWQEFCCELWVTKKA